MYGDTHTNHNLFDVSVNLNSGAGGRPPEAGAARNAPLACGRLRRRRLQQHHRTLPTPVLSISIYLSIYTYIFLSIYLSIYLNLYTSIYTHIE